jgi:uncharacterized protein
MKNRYQDIINELSDRELLFHLYLTQLILLAVSFILGLFIYRDLSFFYDLFNWQDRDILKMGVTTGLLVVLLDLLLMKVLPNKFYDDGGLNERIFQNRNVFHIAIIALIVSYSEELLFRGIIQTQFGLIAASVIFALIHYRYLFNWFLFCNIVTLSFVIGLLYSWTGNLAVTFTMHFIVDFLLGLLIMIKNKKSQSKGSDFS